MDSKEREQREKDGFGEQGEQLYDAGKNDERKKVREEKKKKEIEKGTPTPAKSGQITPQF